MANSASSRDAWISLGLLIAMVFAVMGLSGCSPSAVGCSEDVNVAVLTYSVGGTYTGLIGSLLSLANNGEFDSNVGPVTGPNGTFTLFHGGLPGSGFSCGDHYNVTITRQPTNPSQTCVIANGAGTVGSANVTSIAMTCTTNPARFVYVANSVSNDVSAYSVDSANGALTAISGSPFPAGSIPDSIVVDPTGRFAYVSNRADSTVSAYTIERSSGALTAVSGSPFATGPGPTSVTTDPSSSFVLVANGDAANVSVYTIDAATGALKSANASPFGVGTSPSFITVQPAGGVAYVANQADGTISALFIDILADGTGTLTPVSGSPFATGAGPRTLAIDSSNQYMYVAGATTSGLSAFAIQFNSGAVTPINGSPSYLTGSNPYSVAIDPLDRFVYVVNEGSNNVSAFALDATRGALTPLAGSPFAAGINPSSLAVDPRGNFTLVTNAGSNTVSVYGIDAASGALTPISGSPFATGTSPSAIAISD